MKKVFSLLLAVLMIASLATVAFAANANEVKAGDTVSVTFSYSGSPAMSDYKARVSYDSSALELIGLSGGTGNAVANVAKAIFVDAQTTDMAAGALFTATFKVLDTAAAGTYQITAAADYAFNAAGEEVKIAISGGSITVVSEPQPTEPQPTEPQPTEPQPTEPQPTEPQPTEHVHVWSAWVVIDAGNCQKKSVEERTCSVCCETETREGEYGPHQYKDGVCVICGTKDPNYVEPTKPVDPDLDDEPKTGDITPVIMMTIVCVVAVAGAFFFVFKRKAAK